jgi:hypothetical protein
LRCPVILSRYRNSHYSPVAVGFAFGPP